MLAREPFMLWTGGVNRHESADEWIAFLAAERTYLEIIAASNSANSAAGTYCEADTCLSCHRVRQTNIVIAKPTIGHTKKE